MVTNEYPENKTESMLISRKLNKPVHPPLFMQEVQIAEVSSHKHLGLILSNDCTWHQHIDYIAKKAWNRINIMRKLKFKLDRSSLEIIFTTFIRPLLEYGDIVWDNCTQFEKTRNWENPNRSRTNCHWNNQTCISQCSVPRNWLGYTRKKTGKS